MVMQPVGPLPASTYWRRRAVLLVGVLVVLLLLKSCTGGGASPKKNNTAGKPTPTVSASAAPKPIVQPSTSPTDSPPPVTAVPTCADGDLTLSGSTDQNAYTVGESPRLTIKVTNKSARACNRDLGQGAVELLVFSGAARQWSSDDCNPSKATAITRLKAGEAQSVVLVWNGKRSLPGCAGTKAQAQPGTYTLKGRFGTLTGQVAVFRFHT